MKIVLGAAILALLVPAQEKSFDSACSARLAQDKPAKDLLQAAVKEAKEKNRRVLLTFGSPG